MTPLDAIAPAAFSVERQVGARLAICRAVHGRGRYPAPAWRAGSNAPLATAAPDTFGVDEPCPFCGGAGADILGGDVGGVGMEYCRSCGNEWIVGDYDWRMLGDCIRYRADLAAGLVAA